MLRVAMVSPYSISIPGGVQAQVLGLAREMRRLGHEVRVLAPCDGPPPEPFVTPLGNSLPASANGSVAPLAPDPSAALRTIRALNDEAFDVIHLHEPLVPGPTVTALLLRLAPTVGTFHSAGESGAYRVLSKTARWGADHLSTRVAVSEAARELAHRYLGGDYEVLFNGIEIDRYVRADVKRVDEPTIFFCGRYEPRKGLEVLLESMRHLPRSVRLWIASDGIGIDDLRNTYSDDGRISWLGRITEEDKLDRLAACSVFCAPSLRGSRSASCCSRRWRRAHRSWRATSTVIETSPCTIATPSSSRQATHSSWLARCARCSRTTTCGIDSCRVATSGHRRFP